MNFPKVLLAAPWIAKKSMNVDNSMGFLLSAKPCNFFISPLTTWKRCFEQVSSLGHWRCSSNLKSVILKLIVHNSSMGIHCDFALRWMPKNPTNNKSTLVQVMAWCSQAISHFTNQCWPRSLSLHWVSRPQRFKTWRPLQNGRYFVDDTCKCVFLSKTVGISIKILLKFVRNNRVHNRSALVQIMAWRLVITWTNVSEICDTMRRH